MRAAAGAKRSPARCAAHPCAAVASVRASLRLGTGESRAARRMWFSLGLSMRTGVCTIPGREGGGEGERKKNRKENRWRVLQMSNGVLQESNMLRLI